MCVSTVRHFTTNMSARIVVYSTRFINDVRRSTYNCRQLSRNKRSVYIYQVGRNREEKEIRANFLSKTLNCPLDQVIDFLDSNPRVLSTGRSKFDKIIDLFVEHKVSPDEIFAHPDIFRRSYDTIRTRFEQIKDELEMGVKLSLVNTGQPLYNKRFAKHLKEKKTRELYSDKSTMLMSHMGCSRQEVVTLIHKNDILRDSKLSTLRQKLEFLVTQGVPTALILEKTWILTVPLEQLESRSKVLRKEGIVYSTCPKSYFFLLKCPNESFTINFKKWGEEKSALGNSKSKQEFLQHKLHCDERQVNTMLKAYPKLLSVSATKLNSTLLFLRMDCCFSSEDIIANGLLFRFSTETLENRYKELNDLGCEVVSAKLLCSDKRLYSKVVDNLRHQLV